MTTGPSLGSEAPRWREPSQQLRPRKQTAASTEEPTLGHLGRAAAGLTATPWRSPRSVQSRAPFTAKHSDFSNMQPICYRRPTHFHAINHHIHYVVEHLGKGFLKIVPIYLLSLVETFYFLIFLPRVTAFAVPEATPVL